MGLQTALVDRARIVGQQAAEERIAGSTRMVTVEGAWFQALLLLPSGTSTRDSSQGRKRVVTSPTLLYDVVDEQNEPVVLTSRDRVEVESQRFGTSTWEPNGDPEPLGSLYEVFGYQLVVKRVVDHQMQPMGA